MYDSEPVRRTRCTPSPRGGEGWGGGVRSDRETLTPHPTPLPMGEGADRARGAKMLHAVTVVSKGRHNDRAVRRTTHDAAELPRFRRRRRDPLHPRQLAARVGHAAGG